MNVIKFPTKDKLSGFDSLQIKDLLIQAIAQLDEDDAELTKKILEENFVLNIESE